MKNIRILFANQKGGVGKTRLCMMFANYLASINKKVLVIDSDLQKSIWMQRQSDEKTFPDEEAPYNVQLYGIQSPQAVQEMMESAKQVPGVVLFDTPGNLTEDGLIPLFVNAEAIICPYQYDNMTLDSTGTFLSVISRLREKYHQMDAKMFLVPNRVDSRVGRRNEQKLWAQADMIFSKFGMVTPRVLSRANIQRSDTYHFSAEDYRSTQDCFEFLMKELINKRK